MEIAMIDFDLIIQSIPALMQGALLSLQITFIASLIGLSFGVVLGFAEEAQSPFLRASVLGYVHILRGTPMLVQILFFYYVLPQFGVVIAPIWAASLAIGLNSS